MSGHNMTLFDAAAKGRLSDAEKLVVLNKGRRAIDAADLNGHTALMLAVLKAGPSAAQVIKKLLSADADPSLTDKQGLTALEHAANKGNPECVALLLESEVNTKVLYRAYEISERRKHIGCAKLIMAKYDALNPTKPDRYRSIGVGLQEPLLSDEPPRIRSKTPHAPR